jgi:hypothetical protein
VNNIVDLKPKGRKKQVTLEDAVEQVRAAGAKEVMLFGVSEDGSDVFFFNIEKINAQGILWRMEQIKKLLLEGDFLDE